MEKALNSGPYVPMFSSTPSHLNHEDIDYQRDTLLKNPRILSKGNPIPMCMLCAADEFTPVE